MNVVVMARGVPFVRHLNQQLVTPPYELTYLSVALDLPERPSPDSVDVIILELRNILDESICTEHGNVIEPIVTWSCRKHNPVIVLGDDIKCFNPFTCSDKSLLVEDEEGILDLLVLVDVVP